MKRKSEHIHFSYISFIIVQKCFKVHSYNLIIPLYNILYHVHGILTVYIFSEDLAGGKNYHSQDVARSVKGKYQGHRGQRSRSLGNFIGQEGTISTFNDLFDLN